MLWLWDLTIRLKLQKKKKHQYISVDLGVLLTTRRNKKVTLYLMQWRVLGWLLSISDEQRMQLKQLDAQLRMPCATLMILKQVNDLFGVFSRKFYNNFHEKFGISNVKICFRIHAISRHKSQMATRSFRLITLILSCNYIHI